MTEVQSYMAARENFANTINRYMKDHNIDSAEMGKLLGVSYGYVRMLCKNQKKPGLPVIAKLYTLLSQENSTT